MIDLDTFLAQVLAVISLTAIFGVATYTYLVTRKEVKKQKIKQPLQDV